MNFSIGQVFSTSFDMIKERFLPLSALWAIFFVLSIGIQFVFGALSGASSLGAGAIAAGGSDPTALASLGILGILSGLVIYLLSLIITFAQQASMTTMASPLARPTIGEAIKVGLKAGLTFLALVIMLIVAYFIFALIAALMVLMFAAISPSLGVVFGILLIPIIVYLLCRFYLVLPVVAVEREFNPITAVNRAWGLSKGNVLGIFLVLLIVVVSAIVVLGIPFFLVFGSLLSLASDPASLSTATESMGAMMFGFTLFVPLFLVYQLFSVALGASVHAAVSGLSNEELNDVFA